MQIDSPKQTAEQKAALMSSQRHLGISPTAAVVFSTQPCRDQNRDRHPRRKELLPEMSGLGVLKWQGGNQLSLRLGYLMLQSTDSLSSDIQPLQQLSQLAVLPGCF